MKTLSLIFGVLFLSCVLTKKNTEIKLTGKWEIELAVIAGDTLNDGLVIFSDSGIVQIKSEIQRWNEYGTWDINSDNILLLNLPYEGQHENFVTMQINFISDNLVELYGNDQTFEIYLRLTRSP